VEGIMLSEPSHPSTAASETVSFNSRAVLISLFVLVMFVILVYFFLVGFIDLTGTFQSLSTVFIATISGSLALGGTLISQLWGKDITSPPRIWGTSPRDGEDNVSPDTKIMASFDRMMNESSINRETFTLKDEKGETIHNAEVRLEGGNAVLSPSTSLIRSTRYVATITKDVSDVAGHPLANDLTWSFRIAEKPTEPTS
jgi:Bacterial Ig-like domain